MISGRVLRGRQWSILSLSLTRRCGKWLKEVSDIRSVVWRVMVW